MNERCTRFSDKLRIIAGIEESQVLAQVLSHFKRTVPQQYPTELPPMFKRAGTLLAFFARSRKRTNP